MVSLGSAMVATLGKKNSQEGIAKVADAAEGTSGLKGFLRNCIQVNLECKPENEPEDEPKLNFEDANAEVVLD